MIYDILTAADIPYHSGSSPADLPASTVAYVFDTTSLDGPDRTGRQSTAMPCVAKHQIRLELYEPQEDPNSEAALEKHLLMSGLLFTKSPREWQSNVQRYLVTYELSYTSKT